MDSYFIRYYWSYSFKDIMNFILIIYHFTSYTSNSFDKQSPHSAIMLLCKNLNLKWIHFYANVWSQTSLEVWDSNFKRADLTSMLYFHSLTLMRLVTSSHSPCQVFCPLNLFPESYSC